MNKSLKLLFIFILSLPIICLAEEKEVMWKWYKLKENNIHYEQNVEDNCENFEKVDKENFIFTEYTYSMIKPDLIEDREILEEYKTIGISREYINLIQINNFNIESMELLELDILDKSGNKILYNFHTRTYLYGNKYILNDGDLVNSIKIDRNSKVAVYFDNTINIRDIVIRVTYKSNDNFKGLNFSTYLDHEYNINNFDHYSTINNKVCNNDYCVFDIKVDEENLYTDPVNINTKVYKYRDKLYKCFVETKDYLPGYHKEMPGYIKDENDYIIVSNKSNLELQELKNIETLILNNNNKLFKDIKLNNDSFNKDISLLKNKSNELNNNVNILSNKIISNNNPTLINNFNKVIKEVKFLKWLFIGFIILTMILYLILIKKVKISRIK